MKLDEAAGPAVRLSACSGGVRTFTVTPTRDGRTEFEMREQFNGPWRVEQAIREV